MYLSAMLMLSDIDFSTPQQKRKKNDINSSTSGGEWSKAASVSTLTPSPEELLSFNLRRSLYDWEACATLSFARVL